MTELLSELLSGNAAHAASVPNDRLRAVQSGQRPDFVSICCSDSRVSQEGMWSIDRPGRLFTPSNIGNQVWDDHAGDRIVDGSILYPIHHCGTEAIVVVGHTGCGAVTAAYRTAMGEEPPGPAGVRKWVEMLLPVIEAGLDSAQIDETAEEAVLVDQLVEYNVDQQVTFLERAAAVPDHVEIYGFVYDFQGVYGDELGRAYLVNLDGETDPHAIARRVPDRYEPAVRSVLFE